MSEYDKLKDELFSRTDMMAKSYIPRMYQALKDEGLTPQDARDKIENDCVPRLTKNYIRQLLPEEAVNKEHAKVTKKGLVRKNNQRSASDRQEEKLTSSPKEIVVATDGSQEIKHTNGNGFELRRQRDLFEQQKAKLEEEIKTKNERIQALLKPGDVEGEKFKILTEENASLRKQNADLESAIRSTIKEGFKDASELGETTIQVFLTQRTLVMQAMNQAKSHIILYVREGRMRTCESDVMKQKRDRK